MTGQDEPTKEDLVEKIEELEQRQEEQESTMRRMMPDRRQALKGLGLLGGGALLGSSSASGATGNAGQIGTTNDRPDVFVDTLDVSSSVNGQIGTSTNRSQIYGSTIDGTQVNGQIGSSTNRSQIYGSTIDGTQVNGQIGSSTNRSDIYGASVNTPTITDADDGTVYDVGQDLAGGGVSGNTATASVSLGGGWTTEDSNNPVLLIFVMSLNTDGTTNAEIVVAVDESGGTTADYTYEILVDSNRGSGSQYEMSSVYLPAGAQIELRNAKDPNGLNTVRTKRRLVL